MKVTLTLTEAQNLLCRYLNTTTGTSPLIPLDVDVDEVKIDAVPSPCFDALMLERMASGGPQNKIATIKLYRMMKQSGLDEAKIECEKRFQSKYWNTFAGSTIKNEPLPSQRSPAACQGTDDTF